MTKIKQRNHNEWFRSISKVNCPSCKAKRPLDGVWSWGEYVRGGWRTVDHFCSECFVTNVKGRLEAHTGTCGCAVTLVGRDGPLPRWLTLECRTFVTVAVVPVVTEDALDTACVVRAVVDSIVSEVPKNATEEIADHFRRKEIWYRFACRSYSAAVERILIRNGVVKEYQESALASIP